MSAQIGSTETSDDGPFSTSKPWRPEHIAAAREGVHLHPPAVRRLAELRVDWLEADRDEQAATTYGDEAARADAKWRKTEAAGQILAEQMRLADDWAAIIREISRVQPRVLVDLVMVALSETTRSQPQELLNVLEPYLAKTVASVTKPSLTYLDKEISAVKGQVADLNEVIASTHPADARGCR